LNAKRFLTHRHYERGIAGGAGEFAAGADRRCKQIA
jgi:hypothetical protein